MPVLAEQELDKLAGQVVDAYIAGTARLDEAAAKVASERGLNPHQIERLTQSANTQTFLRLMDRRKEANEKDLLHEFEPIDARHVIKIVIDDAGVHIEGPGQGEECTCPDENELPDEMSGLRDQTPMEDEPVKAASSEEQPPSEREQRALQGRLIKVAAILQNEILQQSFIFEEKFDALIDQFRRRPEKYASFERDARVEYGSKKAYALLDLLRGRLKLSPVTEWKNEKSADFHVSEDTPELNAFEGMLGIVDRVNQLDAGLERINAQCGR